VAHCPGRSARQLRARVTGLFFVGDSRVHGRRAGGAVRAVRRGLADGQPPKLMTTYDVRRWASYGPATADRFSLLHKLSTSPLSGRQA
jgi:hypothetical protein